MTELILATSLNQPELHCAEGFNTPEEAFDHAHLIQASLDSNGALRQLIGSTIFDLWWSWTDLHIVLDCYRAIVFHVAESGLTWRIEDAENMTKQFDEMPVHPLLVKFNEYPVRVWNRRETLAQYLGAKFVGIYVDDDHIAVGIEGVNVLLIFGYRNRDDNEPFLYWQQDHSSLA